MKLVENILFVYVCQLSFLSLEIWWTFHSRIKSTCCRCWLPNCSSPGIFFPARDSRCSRTQSQNRTFAEIDFYPQNCFPLLPFCLIFLMHWTWPSCVKNLMCWRKHFVFIVNVCVYHHCPHCGLHYHLSAQPTIKYHLLWSGKYDSNQQAPNPPLCYHRYHCQHRHVLYRCQNKGWPISSNTILRLARQTV